MEKKKVTVVLYPDEDGGYTAVMPYFPCNIFAEDSCLTGQGETAEEALAEVRSKLGRYLIGAGPEGLYHLAYAMLDGLEVRELEVEVEVE